MNHHSGLFDVRRIAVMAFALFMAFVMSLALITASADAKKKAKVTINVQTKNQANLLNAKKINLKVRATAPTTLYVKVNQGGNSNRFSTNEVRFNKARTKKFSLSLTQTGRDKLGTCGAKTVTVVGKYSKFKTGKKIKRSTRKKTLAKDPKACPSPPVPVEVPLGDNPESCDFLDTSVCLQPFPNDYYTKDDPSTPTGKMLNLAPDSTPVNTGHANPKNLSVTEINQSDGFSPGSLISLKVKGLSTPAAFANTGLVPLDDISAYKDADQPVLLIDAATGERQAIWAELDANPTTVDPGPNGPGGIGMNPGNPGPVNLLIRPAKNLEFGHRYIIAFRNLKNAESEPIEAPIGFEVYRDNLKTDQPIVEGRREHMDSVIDTLNSKAGVERSSIYMAWEFTVASEENITGRSVDIRDDAFAKLGDTNLADRKIAAGSDSPEIVVSAFCDAGNNSTPQCGNNYPFNGDYDPNDPTQSPVPNNTTTQRTVVGYLDNVPCYLDEQGCPSGAEFTFNPDGSVKTDTGFTTRVPFRCLIPKSVVAGGVVHPGGTGTYGHGLLGTLNQINATEEVANTTNSSWCAANWDGFSEPDLGLIIASLGDMSNFHKAVDRMQQGFVNFMMIQRALIHPDGFADEPAFNMTFDGTTPLATPGSAIDTSDGLDTRGYYYGISQGGIMGGALTALDPDVDAGVLGVPGINYSTLLRRSVDSDEYFKLPGLGLYANYPDLASRPVLLSLMQILWDRGEGNGYAHNLTDNPLPNTNPHEVLLQLALGDHQVTNYAAEVEARTIGAQRYSPTLLPERTWDMDYEALPPTTGFPAGPNESFMVYYDGGPQGFVGNRGQGSGVPPLENVPPRPEWGYGGDPHGYPRRAPDAIAHLTSFYDNGTIGACAAVDQYCYANGW
ncbi:MAG: hypothetical protein ACSLFD_00155, partial [Solirubrobacterales bacterium]